MSDTNLVTSVETLAEFLRPTGSEYWIKRLNDIATRFRSDKDAETAARDLEGMFGGMGSLNDLYFCETNRNLPAGENENEFNDKFSRLMDQTFKELRLRKAGPLTRLQWAFLSWKHRKELAPRIKKTFGQRKGN